MKENSLITYYSYDANGYYVGKTSVQVVNGKPLVPDNCTDIAPELDDGYWWFKFTDGTWVAEHKPESAAECVGITVKHTDNSPRGVELKALFAKFTDNNSEYRLVRDAELNQTVEKIPAKTADELELSDLEDEQQLMEAQLEDLKNQYLVAQITGDSEKMASVQSEYQSLVGA